MRVALPDWTALALFAGMILAVTLHGLALSGHFPAEHRRASLRGGTGGAVLWGTTAVTVLVAIWAVRFAWTALPGYAAVLAAGASVLVAPLLLKPLPDYVIDERSGLVGFAALSALLALFARM